MNNKSIINPRRKINRQKSKAHLLTLISFNSLPNPPTSSNSSKPSLTATPPRLSAALKPPATPTAKIPSASTSEPAT